MATHTGNVGKHAMAGEHRKNHESPDGKMTAADVVLAVLHVGNIRYKARFQAEVFLAWKEVFLKHSADLAYAPSSLGPHSELVDDSARHLARAGLIEIRWPDRQHAIYSITRPGMKQIRGKLDKLGLGLSKMVTKKLEYTNYGANAHADKDYPEFLLEANSCKAAA